MSGLDDLIEGNKNWLESLEGPRPGYFHEMAQKQTPSFLWIGCADSRVPATVVTSQGQGSLFVHRNIANVVVNTDMNCMSVVQYAIQTLKVRHVVVCGHYGCGGVQAALGETSFGLIDCWLRHIKDVYAQHAQTLDALDEETRFRELVELNVKAQVRNLAATTIVQGAWARGQDLTIHGLVFDLETGRLLDLQHGISSAAELPQVYRLDLKSAR